MALHKHTPKERKKIKKEKGKSKKKPLVTLSNFDPAHPSSSRGVAARELRKNRKKNGR